MNTASRTLTALSVNLNKVALVRNTRHLGIPSVTRAATLCLQAGAAGITVHPRPDARHIRAQECWTSQPCCRPGPGVNSMSRATPFTT
jgi:pyridoxine 5-phosphate synthase